MENIIISVNAVAPMFFTIALGYLARQLKLLSPKETTHFNSVAFRIFMPFMVFYNIYTTDKSSVFRPRLILFTVCALLLVWLLAFFFVISVEKRPQMRGVMIQGIFRSNYALLGIPLFRALCPETDPGAAAIMIAIVVPIYNVGAVITLELFRAGKIKFGQILLSIAKNPMIIGSVLGILALESGLQLPTAAAAFVKSMSQATSPLLLFLMGASFHFIGMRENWRDLTITVIVRLVAVPAIVLSAAALLGFRGTDFVILMGIFTASTATSSFVMAQQMGGDPDLAADVVVVSAAACCITMFLWTLACKQLGLY